MFIEYNITLKGNVTIKESASKNDTKTVPSSTQPSAEIIVSESALRNRRGGAEDVKSGTGGGGVGSGLSIISFTIICPCGGPGQPDAQSPRRDISAAEPGTKSE